MGSTSIERVGATLCYLPPYSPDLNPIELCFAKLKALVRAARCRSTETLWPFLAIRAPHGHEKRFRSGPRIVDSVLSEISTGFQAAVFTATCSKYTASVVRRSSAV